MTDCLVKQESPTPERRIALTLAAHLDHFGHLLDSCRSLCLPSLGGRGGRIQTSLRHRDYYGLFKGWLNKPVNSEGLHPQFYLKYNI